MYDKNTTLMKRILAVIGTIETSSPAPGCFSKVAGDFDGAGISFGIFQWNIGQNTLQPLLKEFFVRYDTLAKQVFAGKYDIVKSMLTRPISEQLAWARSIQKNNKPSIPYDSIFKTLGETEEFQNIQINAAKSYFDRGVKMAKEYGLTSELGIGLMVDIAVQNGSINAKTKDIIVKEIAAKGFQNNEQEKMKIIANRRAEAANAKWVEDVRKRKLMFANGFGIIHGINFDLRRDYALDINTEAGVVA